MNITGKQLAKAQAFWAAKAMRRKSSLHCGLSAKQAALAQKICWKYKRQLPDALVERMKFSR